MRLKIVIICGIVLAACLWFVLSRAPQQKPKADLPEVQASVTNEPFTTQPAPPAKIATAQDSTPARPPSAMATDAVGRGSQQAISEMRQRALEQWQAPINFYGKVVDENTNPVAGVDIHFRWSELPQEGGERVSDTQSDAEGLFSLNGKLGRSLTVWFSKEGYYSSQRGQKSFNYALGPDILSPDPMNPVIFQIRKKGQGADLIKTDFPSGPTEIVQLHHDGTPVELDLIKGVQVPAGNGQLKLEFWRDLSNRNANVFDWKLQLSVPNGGLVPTDEEFAFQAPGTGYQSPWVIDMPATNQNWLGELHSKYYIQLPNGNYGRIDLYLLPDNGVFSVHSTINPTGSGNLEPQ